MQLSLRWIPSELNPADFPSRAREVQDFSLEEAFAKFAELNASPRGATHSASWRRNAFRFHSNQRDQKEGNARARAEGASQTGQDGDPPLRTCRETGEALWEVSRPDRQGKQELPGEEGGVNPAEKSYEKAWVDFKGWARTESLPIRSVEELDLALTNKINVMFFEGLDPTDAVTLVAAAKYYTAKTTEAMKGFRKLEPPQGRLPCPWPMLCVIVEYLWQKHYAIALWLLTIWATCCRPGEALKLRKKHLVPPSAMCKHWIIILNAGLDLPGVVLGKRKDNAPKDESRAKMVSKVGESDEAIIVDQPYMQGFGEVLASYVHKKQDHELIFDFSMHKATVLFNEVLVDHNYLDHGITCAYQLRHGSASSDVLQGLRTLGEVQKRGRWNAAKSVRRYSNGGRVSQVYDSLTPNQKANAEIAERWMAKIFDAGLRRKRLEMNASIFHHFPIFTYVFSVLSECQEIGDVAPVQQVYAQRGWQKGLLPELAQLLRGIYGFYAEDFHWTRDLVSITPSNGGALAMRSAGVLRIQDPVQNELDLAQPYMDKARSDQLRQEIQDAFQQLRDHRYADFLGTKKGAEIPGEHLHELGRPAGVRILDLCALRENRNRRETRLLPMLNFIASAIWTRLFGHSAELLKGQDHENEYMLNDKALLVNRFISVPRDLGDVNCGAFVAGMVEGMLCSAEFPGSATAHTVEEPTGTSTTILIKFEEKVMARERRSERSA
eukprot:symbB.v1.2.023089.t1/scaffold2089.1/size89944/4